MKTLAAAALLLALVSPCQTNTVSGVPNDLEGTGRTCFGHFLHTSSRVAWKAPFSRCSSEFQVLEHSGLHWKLKVHKSNTCSFEVIDIVGSAPGSENEPYWNITGYTRASEFGKASADSQGCGMIPTNWKPQ